MKFILGLFVLLSLSAWSQTVNIPDPNFRDYLLNHPRINPDQDSVITVQEAAAFEDSIIVRNAKIASLEGIEAFVNLRFLICNGNVLTTLDLRKNQALELLQCSGNFLQNIYFPDQSSLTQLFCHSNQLYHLKVENCTKLINLNCSQNYLQYSMDVSHCGNLKEFNCNNNPDLKIIFIPDRQRADAFYQKDPGQYWFEINPSMDENQIQAALNDSIESWKKSHKSHDFGKSLKTLCWYPQGEFDADGKMSYWLGACNRMELRTYSYGGELKMLKSYYMPLLYGSASLGYRRLIAFPETKLPSNCISAGVHFFIFGLETLYYFSYNQNWFFINPKIGMDFGALSIFYGYNIPLHHVPFWGSYGHNVAINLDFNLIDWVNYQKDRKNSLGY